MTQYDKENLQRLIKLMEEKLEKLKSIPKTAELVYTNQGENIVGYRLPGNSRTIYI